MKTTTDLTTTLGENGVITVDGQEIGALTGLRVTFYAKDGKYADKSLMNAAEKTVTTALAARAADVLKGIETDFSLDNTGNILWQNEKIATLAKGNDILHPVAVVSVHESLDSAVVEQLRTHINRWLSFYLNKTVAPLYNALAVLDETPASGNVRAILFQVAEKYGIIRREKLKEMLKVLTEDDKKVLAKAGIRLGYDFLFFPMLLKPAAQRVLALLWKLNNDKTDFEGGLAIDGKMSLEIAPDVPKALYFVQGYIAAGKRAIRVDVMERFTSKLRELTRQDKEAAQPLPLDLLSTAGLKRDEAQDVFGFLGFDVIKETTGEGDAAKETLMIRMKPKKTPVFKQQQPSKPRKANKKGAVSKKEPADLSDSPFACLAALKKK